MTDDQWDSLAELGQEVATMTRVNWRLRPEDYSRLLARGKAIVGRDLELLEFLTMHSPEPLDG